MPGIKPSRNGPDIVQADCIGGAGPDSFDARPGDQSSPWRQLIILEGGQQFRYTTSRALTAPIWARTMGISMPRLRDHTASLDHADT